MSNVQFSTQLELDPQTAAGLSPAHKKVFMVMHNLEYDLMMQKEGFILTLHDYDNAETNVGYFLEFVMPLLDNIHSVIKDISYHLIMTRKEDLALFLQIFYNSIVSEANEFNSRRAAVLGENSELKFNYDVNSIMFRYFFWNLRDWCFEQRNKDIKDVVSIGWEDADYSDVVNYISELNFEKSA